MKIWLQKFLLLVCWVGLLGVSGCKTAGVQSENSRELPDLTEIRPYASPPSLRGRNPHLLSPEHVILFELQIPTDQVGYVLYDPQTKKVLSEHRSDDDFMPASISKMISTAAALKILGPDHRFKTDLLSTGAVKNHVLHGDIYLRGTGDPFLTAGDLMILAESLKAKGIEKVEGSFFYDDTFLLKEKAIDPLRDEAERYNPGVSALSSEFNQLEFFWRREPGDLGILEAFTIPDDPQVELGIQKSNETPAPDESWSKKPQWITGSPENLSPTEEKDKWFVDPEISAFGSTRLPVRNTSAFTSGLFQKLVSLHGIELPSAKSKKTPSNAKLLRSKQSLPLIKLVEGTLEYSNNSMAELIQMAAARKLDAKPLSLKASAERIAGWWKKKIPDAHWEGFHFENGSGLGAANQVTPGQLARVLGFADQASFLKERSYSSLLPISGWKGTLIKTMQNPDLAFRVWAKTGGQSYCKSLAGYVFTDSGKKLAFVIVGNDPQRRALVDLKLEPNSSPYAISWGSKIRLFQEEILREWIKTY